MSRLAEHLLRRPLLDQSALAEKHDMVCHLTGKADFMSDHHQRDAQLRQALDDVQHLADQFRIKG